MKLRWLFPAAALVFALLVFASPASAQQPGVYRTVTVQAAPGQLLELMELYREERTFLAAQGEEAPLWMRHSQGDLWDLFLLYPLESVSAYFSAQRAQRLDRARTPSGRTGAELRREIERLSAWREEVFVNGPAVAEVKDAWSGSGFFHVEMFEGLAGRRADLLREREMENDYLIRMGRKPNHIFTRIAGSATDSYTIGYYVDLKAYANPPARTPAQQEAAAVAAGFRGADTIGSELRALILRHHDTLAVRIP